MTALDFATFFHAVHGQAPFPWQAQAAARLARRETFAVTVPTGLGKSAMVDAALWAAASGAWRRVAFVVDRRIVVDAVYERAQRIRERLAATDEPALQAFAEALGPIQVERLRGGVFGDDDWVLYPDRVSVMLTTVDQLGSRLLFRGYGVNPRRWPMHAGFFGHDTLVIVDEAHLSRPFLQTLTALQRHGAGVAVVPMSATLGQSSELDQIGLEAPDLALPVVLQRLRSRKRVTLLETGSAEAAFVQTAVDQAQAFAGQGAKRVALVVNRVATARKCFERLVAAGANAVLLTGRVRPIERDQALAELLPKVQAGRERRADDAPLIVVATQTIEVGADFDFDALVTECASLSALRQRFGRLDRLGVLGECSGVILCRQVGDKDDPVYGSALADTWEWLKVRAEEDGGAIDFGLAALDGLLSQHAAPEEAPRQAATLLPAHLDMLAQTGPYAPELDVGAWLHGASDRAPDVTLVWRDDLPQDDPSSWPATVALLPPMLREGLTMPASAVRRWLTKGRQDETASDLESAVDDRSTGPDEQRPVLRWRGADDSVCIAARDIRPGDTLVLPSAYGGCDVWGWAPQQPAPVVDLADACLAERLSLGATRRVVLRLADGHWAAYGSQANELQQLAKQLRSLEERASTGNEDLEDELQATRSTLLDAALASGHPLVASLQDARLERHPGGHLVRGLGIEEIEGAVEVGHAVPLDVHHADVGRWAEALAAGHPHGAEIRAAALVHDAGKAEPPMQALLHGSPLLAARGPLLAKSALRRRDELLAAWKNAGVPRGFRHEFASLDYEDLADPLVRHLVATHHGYGRPWLRPCADRNASGAAYAALGRHWLSHWSKVLSEHNPWTLATMEWLLRAADARASIEEAAETEGDDGTTE